MGVTTKKNKSAGQQRGIVLLHFAYMRDDHLFAPLPTQDVSEFVAEIKKQFDQGYTAGMVCGFVCGEHIAEVVHARGRDHWEDFRAEAERWFRCQHAQASFDPILMGC